MRGIGRYFPGTSGSEVTGNGRDLICRRSTDCQTGCCLPDDTQSRNRWFARLPAGRVSLCSRRSVLLIFPVNCNEEFNQSFSGLFTRELRKTRKRSKTRTCPVSTAQSAPGASSPYKRWSKCTVEKVGGSVFAEV